MINKAWDYIKINHMLEKEDRIVVGVSGGADSVCLLYVLKELCSELMVTLTVVHVNHGIRGEEAASDELFVKELCNYMGIEFIRYAFDVKKIAAEQGLSEEEAGRKVRYDAFLDTCYKKKCNKIAIAHNKNDNAETVLFNLFRGSGIKGLSGIEAKRIIQTESGDVTIIRPLLCAERKEIEEYLKSNSITYRIDSTNLTEDYTRNKIRNRILPFAANEINIGVIGNINEAASQLSEINDYISLNVMKRWKELVKQFEDTYLISVQDMQKEPVVIQKGILLKIMGDLAGSRKDLEAKHVDAVLSLFQKQVGRYVHLPYRMIAEREYENIKFFCIKDINTNNLAKEIMAPVIVKIPGRTVISKFRKIFEIELVNYKKNDPILKSSCAKWFDYDKIENAVEIRTRKEGDYIQVNRFGGNKKLKDYFIDVKIPQKLRDSQILITDGSHVMWIPGTGERMSEKYKVDETTTKVLLMKMFDLEEMKDDR